MSTGAKFPVDPVESPPLTVTHGVELNSMLNSIKYTVTPVACWITSQYPVTPGAMLNSIKYTVTPGAWSHVELQLEGTHKVQTHAVHCYPWGHAELHLNTLLPLRLCSIPSQYIDCKSMDLQLQLVSGWGPENRVPPYGPLWHGEPHTLLLAAVQPDGIKHHLLTGHTPTQVNSHWTGLQTTIITGTFIKTKALRRPLFYPGHRPG